MDRGPRLWASTDSRARFSAARDLATCRFWRPGPRSGVHTRDSPERPLSTVSLSGLLCRKARIQVAVEVAYEDGASVPFTTRAAPRRTIRRVRRRLPRGHFCHDVALRVPWTACMLRSQRTAFGVHHTCHRCRFQETTPSSAVLLRSRTMLQPRHCRAPRYSAPAGCGCTTPRRCGGLIARVTSTGRFSSSTRLRRVFIERASGLPLSTTRGSFPTSSSLGKSLTGGTLPLAAVIASDSVFGIRFSTKSAQQGAAARANVHGERARLRGRACGRLDLFERSDFSEAVFAAGTASWPASLETPARPSERRRRSSKEGAVGAIEDEAWLCTGFRTRSSSEVRLHSAHSPAAERNSST